MNGAKKTKSLYFKNFITIVAVILLSFAVLAVSFTVISYRFIIRNKTDTMRKDAVTAGRIVSAYEQEWGLSGLEVRAALMWLSDVTGFHMVVCDQNGTVVSCSDRTVVCPHIGKTLPSAALSKISSDGEYYGLSTMDGLYDHERYIVGTALQADKDGNVSYLFLSAGAGEMSLIWRQFAGLFALAAVAAALIAFAISYFTTRRQAKPIREMAAAADKFGHGDFSVRVAQDPKQCTEMGELAEAFNMMADSLERSEAARRDLIANVSHELKTPMTTITGFADGILDGTIPPEKEKEYLGVISSETKRLSRLVRGMLDMSQLQAKDPAELRKKSFDLSEVVCQALLSLEKKINDRGLDVDAQLPEEPVVTLGDRDAITQVVYNLIDNAAKFATKGSVIRLELWKQEDKAYVSVENDGETISKEELPLIFDRFHKTDHSRSMDREGVGLGLYIVKTILDNHGEEIFVTSKDGVTKFVFTLTLAPKN